jgi:arginyl-tRNA synthetase
MNIEQILQNNTTDAVKILFSVVLNKNLVQIQKTKTEFAGDYTINVFPFVKQIKKSPESLANEIGTYLVENIEIISSYNVIKGFLNITVSEIFWLNYLLKVSNNENIEIEKNIKTKQNILIEFSSPNTNKPLHLGHIRNNLLGDSVSRIMAVAGHDVTKVNLVNDRGIHICKSMLAWQKWGNDIIPEKAKIKGDKLVGNFYVKFDEEYKKQINELISTGKTKEVAEKEAPLIVESQKMLQKWESGDKDIIELWQKMNAWVYDGFEDTYKTLGITFDKIYYESETYKLGKSLVLEGVKNNIFIQKEDSSVWADLTSDKLDEKILLRSDGTSVYITQDIGTANQRFKEFDIDKHIYVVGNEQNYHFKVLKLVLKKLGFNWSDKIFHLSYGMVELPEGKMKSREGTVVDADDLIENMINVAKEKADELGKLEGFSIIEKNSVYKTIALGALKYFILKVDPKKSMLFNPKESIDFNGNTGPFIQYSYARIKSIENKATQQNIKISKFNAEKVKANSNEINLIKLIYGFSNIVNEASKNMSPALIANYSYDIAKEYNQFYHEYSILSADNKNIVDFRLTLSSCVAKIIKKSMELLGIGVPDRM